MQLPVAHHSNLGPILHRFGDIAHIAETQCGFRPRRSTLDMIFIYIDRVVDLLKQVGLRIMGTKV